MRDADSSLHPQSTQRVEVPSGYAGPAVPQGADPALADDWSGRLKHPVILRVPRGYIIITAVAFIGLLILGYFVGYYQGYAQRDQTARAELDDLYGQLGAPSPINPLPSNEGPSTRRVNPDETSNGAQTNPSATQLIDRRQPGLNYLRLFYERADESRRLAQFLSERGVEISAKSMDNGFFVLYASDKGFAGGDRNSSQAQQYEQQLRRLGRAWKRHNQNRGNDLSDMIWELCPQP